VRSLAGRARVPPVCVALGLAHLERQRVNVAGGGDAGVVTARLARGGEPGPVAAGPAASFFTSASSFAVAPCSAWFWVRDREEFWLGEEFWVVWRPEVFAAPEVFMKPSP
jgi:hypothetical protein